MKMKSWLLPAWIVCLAAGCHKHPPASRQNPPPGGQEDSGLFARGADVSWLTQMEASGYLFYDSLGKQEDCLQILKDKSLNASRLRAWVNPPDGWCSTHDVVVKALRASSLGFRIMIDLHYSDSWADPGKQTKPLAWDSLGLTDLSDTLYSYTYHLMDTLKQNGIIPAWIQLGNETNDGMLWEDGRASTHMANFAMLINSGFQAVRALTDSTKIIVHISNGYDNTLFRWVFDGLKGNGANYDIIGMSLYPSTADWASLNQQCLDNMNDMVTRYGKKVMICEIGMDVTQPATCRAFIGDLVAKTRSVTGGKGLGVFYWEPESYNWESYGYGAFDNTGKPTIALDGFSDPK
jgi:arabinogalactan endo-1,4-beta-galactosidase